MDWFWDIYHGLLSLWKEVSAFTVLLMIEGAVYKWWPKYKGFARYANRRWFIRASLAAVLFVPLLSIAYLDERQKNIENRAQLGWSPGDVFNVEGKKSISAYMSFKNYGKTTAIDAVWEVGVNVLSLSGDKKTFNDLGSPQIQEGPHPVKPSQVIQRHPEIPWSSIAIKPEIAAQALKAGSMGIFVFGHIEYKSAGKKWESGVCYLFKGGNTYNYKPSKAVSHFTAYPSQEFTPCPNPELSYGPREISQP